MNNAITPQQQAEDARAALLTLQVQTPMFFPADHKVRVERAHASKTRANTRAARAVNGQLTLFAPEAVEVKTPVTGQLSLF